MKHLLTNPCWSKHGPQASDRFVMKAIRFTAVLTGLLVMGTAAGSLRAAGEEGVALAIVYDTSGSMKEPVPDGTGRPAPKYVIANRALEAIASQIRSFTTNSTTGAPRPVQAGLFVFTSSGARQAIPFGPFDAAVFQAWARDFKKPEGGTPLGAAVQAAAETVLKSPLAHKHILVITDGMNTVGPDPAKVLPGIRQKAGQQQTTLGLHFVAFDVNADVFSGVKKLGATVVGAANETQLNKQLEFILQKKILLEDEEPSPKAK